FSYNGEVNFGITGDYDTTADIDVLCRGIEDGVKQLLKAGDRAEAGPSDSDGDHRQKLGSVSDPPHQDDDGEP
ncbi:MAG: hypothetical protein ACRDYE_00955, partial [Acidimicrobiales bacterium]